LHLAMKILLAQNFEPPALHLHLAMRTRNLDRAVTAFLELEAAIQLFERTVAKKNIALLAAHFAFDGHLRAFRE
jgi:hypothetical protein